MRIYCPHTGGRYLGKCPFPYNYKIKYTEIDKKEIYDRHYNHSNINIQ